MLKGMQTPDANGRLLMLAYLKHFTAYSKEANRGHDTYNVSMQAPVRLSKRTLHSIYENSKYEK